MNQPPLKFDFSKPRTAGTPLENVRLAAAAIKQSALADDTGEREFDFNDKDFARIRALILKIAGISLAPSKQSMVYSRLARRLRACNQARFSSYLDALEASPHNLTSFYREAHHFEILKKQLQSLPRNSRIELWCSAASTGEEPYTMAITAMEAFQSMNTPVRILATDIDTKVLEHARKGVYRLDQVEKIPEDILRKYFLKGKGESEGLIRLRPEVQALVTFRKLNLMDTAWQLRPGFDAVFCRNVMIYFEKDVQLQILKRFAPLMNKKGLLYAWHSENFAMAKDYFTLRGKTVYAVNDDKAAKGGPLSDGEIQRVGQ